MDDGGSGIDGAKMTMSTAPEKALMFLMTSLISTNHGGLTSTFSMAGAVVASSGLEVTGAWR